MRTTDLRPTKRWAAAAVVAGSVSAVVAAPMTLGTAAAHSSTPAAHSVTPAERPLLTANDIRRGVIALHAQTNPGLEHATIYFYKLVHGKKKLIGYESTGPAGRAHVHVHLRPGSVHRFVARWRRIHNYRFNASNPNVPTKSRYSNVIKYRTPS